MRNNAVIQCSWWSTGVIWQNLPRLTTILAATWWRLCNLPSRFLGTPYNKLLVYLSATKEVNKSPSSIRSEVPPSASNVVQVIECSTVYFGNVYGHSKLVIEPRTQLPYNSHFANIAVPDDDGVKLVMWKLLPAQDLTYPADVTNVYWRPNPHLLGFGCIYLEPDPNSLLLQCLELLSHVGDPLAQQNHVVHNFRVL